MKEFNACGDCACLGLYVSLSEIDDFCAIGRVETAVHQGVVACLGFPRHTLGTASVTGVSSDAILQIA